MAHFNEETFNAMSEQGAIIWDTGLETVDTDRMSDVFDAIADAVETAFSNANHHGTLSASAVVVGDRVVVNAVVIDRNTSVPTLVFNRPQVRSVATEPKPEPEPDDTE